LASGLKWLKRRTTTPSRIMASSIFRKNFIKKQPLPV
jgi:hypothetical protein